MTTFLAILFFALVGFGIGYQVGALQEMLRNRTDTEKRKFRRKQEILAATRQGFTHGRLFERFNQKPITPAKSWLRRI